VATIRIEDAGGLLDGEQGLPPLCIARNGRPLTGQALNRILYGSWGGTGGESVVLCRVSENIWEIHCHGGRAAAAKIVEDLSTRGAAATTQATFLTHGEPLIEEAWRALTRATTLRTADLLLEQATVAWPHMIEEFKNIAADGERSRQAAEMLSWWDFGRHLTTPWRVALCGRPNAGKSSLMNALAGFARSIVHDHPGTTRDLVTLETAFEGWPVQLIDTAGLREEAEEIESQGIERARRAAADADAVILVVDGSEASSAADRELMESMPEAILAWNKSDAGNRWEEQTPDTAIPISAKTNQGLESLIARLIERLIPRLPAAGQPYPVCEVHAAWLKELLAAS
jgi:tRNA modification GTPase